MHCTHRHRWTDGKRTHMSPGGAAGLWRGRPRSALADLFFVLLNEDKHSPDLHTERKPPSRAGTEHAQNGLKFLWGKSVLKEVIWVHELRERADKMMVAEDREAVKCWETHHSLLCRGVISHHQHHRTPEGRFRTLRDAAAGNKILLRILTFGFILLAWSTCGIILLIFRIFRMKRWHFQLDYSFVFLIKLVQVNLQKNNQKFFVIMSRTSFSSPIKLSVEILVNESVFILIYHLLSFRWCTVSISILMHLETHLRVLALSTVPLRFISRSLRLKEMVQSLAEGL